MIEGVRKVTIVILAVLLSLFTVLEVNLSKFDPLSQLAVFGMLGIVLCFLTYPLTPKLGNVKTLRIVDMVLAIIFALCCGYLIVEGDALSNERVGQFTQLDYLIAIVATIFVLEATRRSIGWALPILSALFLAYAFFGPSLPDALFPHRGYDLNRVAAKCFLGKEGIFGVAMRVMFTYVYLFVVFGAFLEMSGATQFIIDFSNRVFGKSAGGPAKVSVLGSGLMGSLSGSAVANAVTTGSFTIPMMRSAGFKPHISGGITAAAASGGALVPPVMGAGAYMMLEIVEPPVDGFMQIVRAALIPAILYYLSILLIVHFYSRRVGTIAGEAEQERPSLLQYEGIVFVSALATLIGFLYAGKTPFRAVTYSLEVIFLLALFGPRFKMPIPGRLVIGVVFAAVTAIFAIFFAGDAVLSNWATWADAAIPGMCAALLTGLILELFYPEHPPAIREAFTKTARGGISLVSASGCVGIIMGVVSLTGVGTAFPNAIVPLAEESLFLALVAIMFCSIVLGMGLPSAVCYLLMAVLIGPVLNRLGVIPLAAHLFIFYFGMMSMVTPPVALAAYASASIAKAKIMPTAMAGFLFSLVGFTLPFMFVYRPALLLLDGEKWATWIEAERAGAPNSNELLREANAAFPSFVEISLAVAAAVVGILALAAGVAGCLKTPFGWPGRLVALLSAAMLLIPQLQVNGTDYSLYLNLAGGLLFIGVAAVNFSGADETSESRPESTDKPSEPASGE